MLACPLSVKVLRHIYTGRKKENASPTTYPSLNDWMKDTGMIVRHLSFAAVQLLFTSCLCPAVLESVPMSQDLFIISHQLTHANFCPKSRASTVFSGLAWTLGYAARQRPTGLQRSYNFFLVRIREPPRSIMKAECRQKAPSVCVCLSGVEHKWA